MLLGLSTFSVFFSHVIGFAGAGGLCTLVLAFLAALGWKTEKVSYIRITLTCILPLGFCHVYPKLTCLLMAGTMECG